METIILMFGASELYDCVCCTDPNVLASVVRRVWARSDRVQWLKLQSVLPSSFGPKQSIFTRDRQTAYAKQPYGEESVYSYRGPVTKHSYQVVQQAAVKTDDATRPVPASSIFQTKSFEYLDKIKESLGVAPDSVEYEKMSSYFNKQYGLAMEQPALLLYSQVTSTTVNPFREITTRCMGWSNSKQLVWLLAGHVDGVSGDRKTVIEIKNRTKALNRVLHEKEMYQLQAYMYITRLEQARLMECLWTSDTTAEICIMETAQDDTMWSTVVLPRMERLASCIAGLMRQTAIQQAEYLTLSATKQGQYVLKHVTDTSVLKVSKLLSRLSTT